MQLNTVLLYGACIVCTLPFLCVICGAVEMIFDDISNGPDKKENIIKLIKVDVITLIVLIIGIALIIFL